ncbi:MAG: hypothetical protein HWQ38_11085 [Nostoc sp. NMS7]|nr:hypothetical protein [Nostoc sp. NMS7]
MATRMRLKFIVSSLQVNLTSSNLQLLQPSMWRSHPSGGYAIARRRDGVSSQKK